MCFCTLGVVEFGGSHTGREFIFGEFGLESTARERAVAADGARGF